MKELEGSQDFSHYNSMCIFYRRSRAANSAVLGPIWPNFELVPDFIDVLVICKYEEGRSKVKVLEWLTRFSPLKPYGSYRLPLNPEFQFDLA